MDAIKQLKKIGLDKVSKETHIYIENLKSLLNKEFNTLHKTKTFGFIKILEKKYDIDLSNLKDEYQAYLNENRPKEEHVTIVAKKQTNSKKNILFYTILFLIVLTLLAFYFTKNLTNQKNSVSDDLNVAKNSIALQETKNSLKSFEKNQTKKEHPDVDLDKIKDISTIMDEQLDSNITIIEQTTQEKVTQPSKIIQQRLAIEPITSLWVGVIYLDNYKRKSYLTSNEIELDPTREQLILTGHSQFEIFHNNEPAFFSSNKKVRFLYQNGTLSEITLDEFKEINGGHDW